MMHSSSAGARDRIDAMLRGSSVDRLPITFWTHFVGEDLEAGALCQATVRYQREYWLDLVKVSPCGLYSVLDYGCTLTFPPDGTPPVVDRYTVQQVEDWARLPSPRFADASALQEQVKAVAHIRAELGEAQPIIATIFSPLTTLRKLATPQAFNEAIARDTPAFRSALTQVAEITSELSTAYIQNGADGIFFATQCATADVCSREQYERFGLPYDLVVLERLPESARRYSMLHLHGDQIYFDIEANYFLGMVSWHDQRTAPSLAEAQLLTSKALAAGLDRETLTALSPEEALALEKGLVDGVKRPMLLAPSCVLRPNTPAQTLHALRQAVEMWKVS